MKFDEEILLKIEDYIKQLNEKVGLKSETLIDIDKVIKRELTILKSTTIKKEAAEEKGYFVEDYANGFIIAFYKGNSAKYYGMDLIAKMQPIIDKSVVFPTPEYALISCKLLIDKTNNQ